MTYTYIRFLTDVIDNLDREYARRLANPYSTKVIGLCYVIGMTPVTLMPQDDHLSRHNSHFRVETRDILKAEIEKLRERRNVFYSFNQGKTKDQDQFIWHPWNYKSRRKFIANLLDEAVKQVKH